MTRIKKRLLIALSLAATVLVLLWIYANSLVGVDQATVEAYRSLREAVAAKGYDARFFVISGRRYWLDNALLATFGGASRTSRHLHGDAIDIIVLDVNGDGEADARDVDIVYGILDREIIDDRGGVGSYQSEWGLLNRQMVHFDLRGHRARWSPLTPVRPAKAVKAERYCRDGREDSDTDSTAARAERDRSGSAGFNP